MPKKFAGENSKAVIAKDRKASAQKAEAEKKQKAAEDAIWEETDKLVLKKQQKKEEELKKQQEKLARKAENDKLLKEEMNKLKSAKPSAVAKVTRYDIENNKEMEVEAKKLAQQKVKEDTYLPPLQENLNRLDIEGESARDVDEAIAILSNSAENEVDKHPEKRLKAAYNEFLENNLQRVKDENKGLKLSQHKQILWKEWLKSPSNPLNNK